MPSAPRTYYRLAMESEIAPLKRNRGAYDGTMVSANLAALRPKLIASTLAELDKPFFMDPCTAQFGLDLGLIERNGRMKKSYEQLVDRIDRASSGSALADRLSKGRLLPDDIVRRGAGGQETRLARVLVKGTVDLQERCLDRGALDGGRRITEWTGTAQAGPRAGVPRSAEFIVSPYFYMGNMDDGWLDVNARLHAMTAEGTPRPYAMICAGPSVLGKAGAAGRIAAAYPDAGGFLLWANAFDSRKAGVASLRRYRTFLAGLVAAGRPVVALYGGYYAALAAGQAGAAGSMRCLSASESRDVRRAVRGGGSPKMYYVGGLHRDVETENAAKALASELALRCRCEVCADMLEHVINTIKPSDEGEKYDWLLKLLGPALSNAHRMHAHALEAKHAAAGVPDVEAAVMGGLTRGDVDRMGGRLPAAHMPRWIEALS